MALKTHVPGSTLIETLVAMVIIMMVIGFSLTIWLNMVKSETNRQNLEARELVNHEVRHVIDLNDYKTLRTEKNDLIIDRSVSLYKADIFLLEVKATTISGKVLYKRRLLLTK